MYISQTQINSTPFSTMTDSFVGLSQVSLSDSGLLPSTRYRPSMASNLSSYGSEKAGHPPGASSKPSSTMTREQKDEKFALGKKGILVFFTLSVLTLMAALDGTSLSVALPVCTYPLRYNLDSR